MTGNQIRYQELREAIRHNYATESLKEREIRETGRANLSREDLARSQLTETIRSNRANENLKKYQSDINLQIANNRLAMERQNFVDRQGLEFQKYIWDTKKPYVQHDLNKDLAMRNLRAQHLLNVADKGEKTLFSALGSLFTNFVHKPSTPNISGLFK